MSQETLAEMIGTTRSRVNFFMNEFRDLGFIEYSGGDIKVNNSLLTVVLHDYPGNHGQRSVREVVRVDVRKKQEDSCKPLLTAVEELIDQIGVNVPDQQTRQEAMRQHRLRWAPRSIGRRP